MNEVYKCYRIYKWRDADIEKGDVGWKSYEELDYTICDYSILLSNVTMWGEDKSPVFKNNKSPRTDIVDKFNTEITILCSKEMFDKVMEEYLSSKVIFKHN